MRQGRQVGNAGQAGGAVATQRTTAAGRRGSGSITDHGGQKEGGKGTHMYNRGQGKGQQVDQAGQVEGQWQHNGLGRVGGTCSGSTMDHGGRKERVGVRTKTMEGR